MEQSVHRGVGRIVAVGDLHGNYSGFHRILRQTGLIDRRDRWVAGDTHLVQLGDILGRGGEPGKIFRLLRRLEQEAPAFGSRVHVLLGNHEAMSMSGMLMYNTLEEFRDLAEEEFLEPVRSERERAPERRPPASTAEDARRGRRLDLMGCREFRESLSPEGRVGRWLAHHDTAVSINGCLFVHGGLNLSYGLMPLDRLNETVRREILAGRGGDGEADWTAAGREAARDTGREIMLRGDGPQWNRELTLRPSSEKQRVLEQVLEFHGCARMVVGHTPTSCVDPGRSGKILPLYGGRLFCIDTGIGKAYGGKLSALRVEGGEVLTEYFP